jgi:hypothetical protein
MRIGWIDKRGRKELPVQEKEESRWYEILQASRCIYRDSILY